MHPLHFETHDVIAILFWFRTFSFFRGFSLSEIQEEACVDVFHTEFECETNTVNCDPADKYRFEKIILEYVLISRY